LTVAVSAAGTSVSATVALLTLALVFARAESSFSAADSTFVCSSESAQAEISFTCRLASAFSTFEG